MNGYSPSTGDREGGAVNRQIRVFLRTSGDDGHSASPLLGPYPAYKPSVTLLDLNKHLRRFGLPISRSYCTQLWFVKDCGGYFGAGFTWMFIFVGEMLVLLVLLMKALSLFVVINGILSFGCAFLGFVAHCRAMFTDPVSCYFVSHLMSTSFSHPSFHHSFTKPLLHSSAPTSNPPTEHCIREVWNWIAYWSLWLQCFFGTKFVPDVGFFRQYWILRGNSVQVQRMIRTWLLVTCHHFALNVSKCLTLKSACCVALICPWRELCLEVMLRMKTLLEWLLLTARWYTSVKSATALNQKEHTIAGNWMSCMVKVTLHFSLLRNDI